MFVRSTKHTRIKGFNRRDTSLRMMVISPTGRWKEEGEGLTMPSLDKGIDYTLFVVMYRTSYRVFNLDLLMYPFTVTWVG